jgi:2-phospho-L-lactate guanylyltransferase (CobY/MobA/RfbA family)
MTSMIAARGSSEARRAGIWAVVPIKRLSLAKQRLAALLGEKREEFAYLLACRTLDVRTRRGLFDGIIVVSPDPRIAAAALRARRRGARRSRRLAERGLCLWGSRPPPSAREHRRPHAGGSRLAFRAGAHRRGAALLGAAGMRRAVGLVRCKDGTGTNMVLLDPAQAFEPRFGPTASPGMRAAAPPRTSSTAPEVAFDIDAAEDLHRFAGMLGLFRGSGPFEKLVLGLGLAGGRALDSARAWCVPRRRDFTAAGGAATR